MSELDEFLYNSSSAPQISVNDMQTKEVLWVQDQNNGTYSGSINIETSSLSNSGKFLAYSESYLEIPLVISFKSATTDLTGVNNTVNAFMVGLKNGHHQLIDGIQVDMGNQNVVSLQPYTNFHVSYKLNTELSNSDVLKYGDAIGFALDNACSAQWSAGASANGDGTSNNQMAPVFTFANNVVQTTALGVPNWRTQLDEYGVNYGFLQRQKSKAFDLQPANGTITAGTGYGSNPGIASSAVAAGVAKNYLTTNGLANANTVWQWSITATIRMRDLCDFFDKIPLLRGVYLRLTINYNSVLGTITTTAVGPSMVQSSLTQLSGRTNPLLVASSALGNPCNLAVVNGGGGVFNVACGIRSTASPASTVSTPLSACRLYVPAYVMNVSREDQYLTMNKLKTITYRDIYNYNILSVGVGGSFNSILTNGLINPKRVIVIPIFNSVAGNNATAVLNPIQSFFDCAPACSSPLAALTNFNVQVSGQNMFQNNQVYDYQQFLDESAHTGINGSPFEVGVQSGLIGFKEFVHNYRYYVCDISRRVPAENSVPKSIMISGSNGCSKILDLYCFVEHEKSIVVDLETGQIVKN